MSEINAKRCRDSSAKTAVSFEIQELERSIEETKMDERPGENSIATRRGERPSTSRRAVAQDGARRPRHQQPLDWLLRLHS